MAHVIIVRTNLPLKQVLHRPDLSARLTKWYVEMSEFEVYYETIRALKDPNFANFIVNMTRGKPKLSHVWIIFTDGLSNKRGSGVRLIIENKAKLTIKVSMRFKFPTTNNQVKYESIIISITLNPK